MKRLPPLPALHTFLITAQCCNFTRAGEQLHITQGAVSRQIAGLEEHLGYPLFHRQARGLSLTEQGQALYPRIEQVFDLIGELASPRYNSTVCTPGMPNTCSTSLHGRRPTPIAQQRVR